LGGTNPLRPGPGLTPVRICAPCIPPQPQDVACRPRESDRL